MTDAEIDSLAREVLVEAIGYVKMMAPLAVQVVTTNTSEPCLEFVGISKQGYGSFRCIYRPLQPIKQLIAESAHIFDNFEITLTDKKTGEVSIKAVNEYIPEHRDIAIEFMGKCAALLLVGSFYPRMGELFQDEFEDHKMMARAILAEWMVTCFESDEFIHNKTDMRAAIDLAVARVADRRRDSLRQRLTGLPNIVAQKGRGGAHNVKHVWNDNDRECLASKYAELQPIWIEAKKIARIAQNSTETTRKREWRKEVLAVYTNLPPDLLERFTTLRADDAKPSDIAVLHAGRLCLPRNVELSIVRLRKELTAWKNKSHV
jgi:hypothetical protein